MDLEVETEAEKFVEVLLLSTLASFVEMDDLR